MAEEEGTVARRQEHLFLLPLIAGCLLPYAHAAPWFAEHGPDVPRFLDELFASAISSFFGWDVIVSVVALLAVAALDTSLRPSARVVVAGGALAGTSVGLPLYLWSRARHRRREKAVAPRP